MLLFKKEEKIKRHVGNTKYLLIQRLVDPPYRPRHRTQDEANVSRTVCDCRNRAVQRCPKTIADVFYLLALCYHTHPGAPHQQTAKVCMCTDDRFIKT